MRKAHLNKTVDQALPLPTIKKDWKFYTGMVFLGLSIILPLFGFLVPLLGLSTGLTALIIGGLTVGGPEVLIILAAAFMGKEMLHYIKAKIFRMLKRRRPLRPVYRFRYYLGLSIMMLSMVPLYLNAYFPALLPSPPGSYSRLYILISADLAFVVSFFICGGQFWEKFKKLFVYETEDTVLLASP